MLLSRFLGPRAATPENPSFNLNSPEAWDTLAGTPSYTGESVSPQSVLTWSAWWRGVSLIAKYVAKCPTHVYRNDDPEGEYGSAIDREHPAYYLLRWEANETMTAFQFKLALTGHAVNRGNGYAYIFRDGPTPVELVLLDPDATEPMWGPDGRLWYVTDIDGEKRKLPSVDVFHLRGFGFDGLCGYPLWEMAKQCIALGIASEKFKATRFKNSARPGVVLESPNRVDDKAKIRLRDDWERMHAGLENAHRTAVLDNGLKASALTFSAEQMQEVEQAGLLLRDAANFLGIPSSKLGDTAGIKYASKEQDDKNFIDDGLDFWFCSFESEGRSKLLSETEKRDSTHLVWFNRESLISTDLAAQANFMRTATGGRPWMTPNEARDRMHMERSDEPDADRLLTPLNMGQGGADNQPQPTDQTDPTQDQPADQQDQQDQQPPEQMPPDNAQAMRAAAVSALEEAARMMVRRVGTHGGRMAKDGKKFMAWIGEWQGEHEPIIRKALAPFSSSVDLSSVFVLELSRVLGHVADTTPAKRLPEVVAEVFADCENWVPLTLAAKFQE